MAIIRSHTGKFIVNGHDLSSTVTNLTMTLGTFTTAAATLTTRLRPYNPGHTEHHGLLGPLNRIHYVMRGWPRWGNAARRRWVITLLNECNATANRCRAWLAAHPERE